MTVNITIPDKKTPGYPRRQYQAIRFYEKNKAGELSSETYLEMMKYFATFLTDEAEKKESEKDIMSSPVWDLSEEQHDEILKAVIGGGSKEIPPLPPPSLEPIVTP